MNVKKIRIEKGLTVQELADMAGLPKRTVEEVMRRDTCSVNTAIKLCGGRTRCNGTALQLNLESN